MQAKPYDAHAWESIPFAPGSLVCFSHQNIPSTQPLLKLNYQFIGPFWVVKMVGSNVAQLDFGCSYSWLHPVFNVSLLTPYADPAVAGLTPYISPSFSNTLSLPPLRDWQPVAGILYFWVQGQQSPEYLLRRVNGTPSDDTWVPLHVIFFDLDSSLLVFYHENPSLPVLKLLLQSREKLGDHTAMAVWRIFFFFCLTLRVDYYCNTLVMLWWMILFHFISCFAIT